MKREICTFAALRYWVLSLSWSVRPLVLFFYPFVCLSFVHLSSVRHQLFTRCRWIFQKVLDSLPLHLMLPSLYLLYLPASSALLLSCRLFLPCHHHPLTVPSSVCMYSCTNPDSSPVISTKDAASCGELSPRLTSAGCECWFRAVMHVHVHRLLLFQVCFGGTKARGVWSDGLLGLQESTTH